MTTHQLVLCRRFSARCLTAGAPDPAPSGEDPLRGMAATFAGSAGSAPRSTSIPGEIKDGEGPAPVDTEALAAPLNGRRGAEDRQDVQRGDDDNEGQQGQPAQWSGAPEIVALDDRLDGEGEGHREATGERHIAPAGERGQQRQQTGDEAAEAAE